MDFKEFFSMSQYVSRGDNKFNSVGCTSSYSVYRRCTKKKADLLLAKKVDFTTGYGSTEAQKSMV